MPTIETLNNNLTKHIELLNDNNILDRQTNFVCPICMNSFDDDTRSKTAEHVPQDSLGGKIIAITCKTCNNTCGTNIDGHLTNFIKKIENKEFIDGSERSIIIETPKGELNAKLIVKNKDDLKLKIDISKNNPYTFDERRNFLKSGSNINIISRSPKIKIKGFNAALLKNAYMIIFSKFGYTFLSNNYYDKFRDQIKKPESEIIPEGLWTLQRKIDIEDGIYLSNYNLYKGFFVVFTLKKLKDHRIMYYIPSPLVDIEIVAYHLRHIERGDLLHLRKLNSLDYLMLVDNIKWIKKWVENW